MNTLADIYIGGHGVIGVLLTVFVVVLLVWLILKVMGRL
jgi:hypothetical protein